MSEDNAMALATLRGVHLAFGGPPLLDSVDFSLEKGERVCLIGRNGAGKSSLLKLIAGFMQPEAGQLLFHHGARVAYLDQEVPSGTAGRVFEVVSQGLGELAALVQAYHDASRAVGEDAGERQLARLARIQHELEAADAWRAEQRVESVISRLELDPDLAFSSLSGGQKRRVLLGRALASEPDLLLLDEPTNHLDIAAIQWLEQFLESFPGAVLFVTHDRRFLKQLATRILELDRGQVTDWPGDYANYLRRREERLHAEAKANDRFDKKLAQEEVWIRQGIKARRTRNEGRVRALKAMRDEFRQRRGETGQARIRLQEAERSGKLVIEAEGVNYAWDGKPVVRDFSTLILRGDKVGILGPNGCGKSTLLGLLLNQLTPDSGSVKQGTKIEVAYFDQQRAQLDEQASVQDNVGEGSDKVTVNGVSKHVLSYLQDFLFTPDRARQPVKVLSGGERNRLLLAKLFTKPANLLVLDEPTNDLDIETLELLEELLSDYQGTLLLVSHDRDFLDNLVSSTQVYEGEGHFNEYVGGYSDWLRQRPEVSRQTTKAAKPSKTQERGASSKQNKLSYKDKRELERLPALIETLENEQQTLQQSLSEADFYKQENDAIARATSRLEQIEDELLHAYARWESLEGQQQQTL
jgi:ATP-binding cassette subfamily F protein uup